MIKLVQSFQNATVPAWWHVRIPTVGLKGKHGKKNVAAVLSMGFFEDNLP